jgi:hypothetical protein
MISNDLCTYQSTGTDYWSYTSYTSGFYTINGGGVRKYLEVASHTNYTNEITSVGSAPCTPVTTSTTTAAPTTTTTTSGASVPTVDTCGGTANLAIANSTSATSVGYTIPTDGSNNLSVCTIGGSPLAAGTSDSFVGAFASSYYTEITNATGKQLRTWVGGTIFSTINIIGSPHLQYGDTGYGSSLVILEIID